MSTGQVPRGLNLRRRGPQAMLSGQSARPRLRHPQPVSLFGHRVDQRPALGAGFGLAAARQLAGVDRRCRLPGPTLRPVCLLDGFGDPVRLV